MDNTGRNSESDTSSDHLVSTGPFHGTSSRVEELQNWTGDGPPPDVSVGSFTSQNVEGIYEVSGPEGSYADDDNEEASIYYSDDISIPIPSPVLQHEDAPASSRDSAYGKDEDRNIQGKLKGAD